MVEDHNKTLDALKIAIQMEIDGKEFYTKAASESGNELGKKLLTTLAAEEDIHRKVFIGIFDVIRDRKNWPDVDFHPDSGRGLRTVFAQAIEKTGAKVKSKSSELGAVKTAREMEAKTYDFYLSQRRIATGAAEKEFYDRLSAQEQEHNLILADYYEYLQNPAAWFVKKEHPHLD
jgi:rubrerythrin